MTNEEKLVAELSDLTFEFYELMGTEPFVNVFGYNFFFQMEKQIELVKKLIREKRFATSKEIYFLIEKVIYDE